MLSRNQSRAFPPADVRVLKVWLWFFTTNNSGKVHVDLIAFPFANQVQYSTFLL